MSLLEDLSKLTLNYIYQYFKKGARINKYPFTTISNVIVLFKLNIIYKMHKLTKYKLYHKKKYTYYGLLSFDDVDFNPNGFDDIVIETIFEKDNLSYIFGSQIIDNSDYIRKISRFLPVEKPPDIKEYVTDQIKSDKKFYSFFAEAFLPIAYRDIYGYKLSTATIESVNTLRDTHTGADACLYNDEKNVLALGEAKFYKVLYIGMKEILLTFTKYDSFENKLESLYCASINNENAIKVLIRQLNSENINEISFREFLNTKIQFFGFIFYNSDEKEEYDSLYAALDSSDNDIYKHISNLFKGITFKRDYLITIFHIPITNKNDFITKVIEYAYKKKEELKNESK